MKNRKVVLIILLILFIITLIFIFLTLGKTYYSELKIVNDKKETYLKLKTKNNLLIKSIKEEENKFNTNQEIIKENESKKLSLEKTLKEKEEEARIKNQKYLTSIKGKVVYLTFDDGPSIYTNDILNTLDKYNVKVTFFVTCSGDINGLAKKILDKGHTLALHTCTHKYSNIYSSEDAYFNDLNEISTRVENITGYKSKYIRFPGGSSNTVSRFNRGIMTRLTKKVQENGYKYYDWNIDSNDAAGANKNQVYSNVIGALKNSNRTTNMVLMHDTKSSTKDALDNIIKDALDMGYTFSNINDYTSEIHHGVNN